MKSTTREHEVTVEETSGQQRSPLGCTSVTACRNSRADEKVRPRGQPGNAIYPRGCLETSPCRPFSLCLVVRPHIERSSSLSLSLFFLPIPVCAFWVRERDAAFNLIRGGRRVRSFLRTNVRTHLLTVRTHCTAAVEVIGSRCTRSFGSHLRFLSYFANWIIGGPRGDPREIRAKRFMRRYPMSPEMLYTR